MDEFRQAAVEKIKKLNRDAVAAELTAQVTDLTAEQIGQVNSIEEYQNDENYEKLKKIRSELVEELMVATEEQESLSEAYPNLVAEARNKRRSLELDANRTGKDKLKHDFFRTKKRAAQNKLRQLGEDTVKRNQLKTKSEEEVQQQYWAKRFAKMKKLEGGMNATGYMGQFIASNFNETKKSRRNMDPVSDYANLMENYPPERVVFDGPAYKPNKATKLHGYKFSPQGVEWNGKVMVLYGGSGDPGCREPGMGDTITAYLNKGFKVYHVDYRGYGKSGVIGSNGKLEEHGFTEKRFYEDGDAILDGVLKDANVPMNKIILHGYSLGGVVASHVAAKCEENLAKRKAEGGNINPEEHLGGVVMDSPMGSMQQTAEGVSGWIATKFGGKYSTYDNLGILYQHAPDIPILFVSGSKKDYLTLGGSKVHKKYNFTHSAYNMKENTGHFACHITEELIEQNLLQNNNANNNNIIEG